MGVQLEEARRSVGRDEMQKMAVKQSARVQVEVEVIGMENAATVTRQRRRSCPLFGRSGVPAPRTLFPPPPLSCCSLAA